MTTSEAARLLGWDRKMVERHARRGWIASTRRGKWLVFTREEIERVLANPHVRRNPPARPMEDRFWEKVLKTDGCWLWQASTARGYGKFAVVTTTGASKFRDAHRVAWELLVGPVPAGMQLDHLCRVPRCVNPAHLEVVTPGENALRRRDAQTVCKRGHAFDAENTRWRGNTRDCRACDRLEKRLLRAAVVP